MEDGSTVVFRLRPATLAAGFVLVFGVIANLAWATAITTTGPWFGASVGIAVYSVSLVLAALLAIVLVHQASARVAHLDGLLARLDRRISLLRTATSPVLRAAGLDDPELAIPSSEFEAGSSQGLVQLEKAGHDTLVTVAPATRSDGPGARAALLRQLVMERIAIREARADVWSAAAGPVVMALGFLAIASPMLPGADGFAAAHYVLNTTLILFLSYGMVPLVGWSILALGLVGSPGIRRRE